MPDSSTFIAFVAASVLIQLIPGPGFLYIFARSINQGRVAGLLSAVGLVAGTLVHVFLAMIGLSAVLMASSEAFTLIKLAGATYLIYLGLKALISKTSPIKLSHSEYSTLSRVFIDGIIVSVFNPKVAIFFLAFLPQFVVAEAGSISTQFLILGLTFSGLALLIDGAFALLSDLLRRQLKPSVLSGHVPRVFSGIVFIGLGIATALMGRRPA
ncbi:MAG: LysE family translocator [Halopseudomonas aestusnigri]